VLFTFPHVVEYIDFCKIKTARIMDTNKRHTDHLVTRCFRFTLKYAMTHLPWYQMEIQSGHWRCQL